MPVSVTVSIISLVPSSVASRPRTCRSSRARTGLTGCYQPYHQEQQQQQRMGDALHSSNARRSRKAQFLFRLIAPTRPWSSTIASTPCRCWRRGTWQRRHRRQRSRGWRCQRRRGRVRCRCCMAHGALGGSRARRRSSSPGQRQSRTRRVCPGSSTTAPMSLQHLLRVRCTECLHIKHTPRPNRLSVQWRLECLAALFAVLVLEGGVAARPAAAGRAPAARRSERVCRRQWADSPTQEVGRR